MGLNLEKLQSFISHYLIHGLDSSHWQYVTELHSILKLSLGNTISFILHVQIYIQFTILQFFLISPYFPASTLMQLIFIIDALKVMDKRLGNLLYKITMETVMLSAIKAWFDRRSLELFTRFLQQTSSNLLVVTESKGAKLVLKLA